MIDGTACLAKLLNDEDLIDTFSSQGLQVPPVRSFQGKRYTRLPAKPAAPKKKTLAVFSSPASRLRAKRRHHQTFQVLTPESLGQHLALTVLHVPCSLNSGERASPRQGALGDSGRLSSSFS